MPEKILRVAWLSVLLGIGMELILVLVATGVGVTQSLKPIAADLVQKVSWSMFVCVGLALGNGAAKHRGVAMGVAGLVAAPLAFNAARTLHKGATQLLAVAGPAAMLPPPVTIALIKAVEYAFLGTMWSRLSSRAKGAKPYAMLGLVTGAVTAAVIIGLAFQAGAKPSTAALIIRTVNEVIFPMGCSLVLYASDTMGRTKFGRS